jgi:hypothetical protein
VLLIDQLRQRFELALDFGPVGCLRVEAQIPLIEDQRLVGAVR